MRQASRRYVTLHSVEHAASCSQPTNQPTMGLFSRKTSSRNNSSNNTSDTHLSANGDGAVKSPFGMKRVNSNPAQNASIPNIPLPKAPDPNLDPAGYLRSIYAVRERSQLVMEKAKRNQLRHFHVDMSKFEDTARFVVSIIKVRRASYCLRTSFLTNTDSETTIPTTIPSHHTAAGNTLKWAGDRG